MGGRRDVAPLISNFDTGCEWSTSPSGHCSNVRNFVSNSASCHEADLTLFYLNHRTMHCGYVICTTFNGLNGRVSTPPPPHLTISQPRAFLFNHMTDQNKKRILRQIWTMSLVLAPYCFERDLFERTHAVCLDYKSNKILHVCSVHQ